MGTKSRKSTRAGKRAGSRSNRKPRRGQWPASCVEQLEKIQSVLIGARAIARVLGEALLGGDESLVIHRHIVKPLTEALAALGYDKPASRAVAARRAP